MKTTHRSAIPSHIRVGRLAAVAVALGSVSASALSASVAEAANGKQVTLTVETVGKMGKVLVDKGKPLYLLTPSGSMCDSSCLTIWPALTLPAGVNGATAGKGVQHGKLGTTAGPNGVRQVTYAGQPVFFFSGDNARGKVKGNVTDQWGTWTAVVVTKSSSGSGSGSSGNSNAGSGGVSF